MSRWSPTARRIAVAFSTVLLLFAVALAVMLVSLGRIGAAEDEVADLDHAKHAGHSAAALAREQYIHQAHTLLEWNDSHLEHYTVVAAQARAATDALRGWLDDPDALAQAERIAGLVAESDRRFRADVVPAIGTSDRSRAADLHGVTEEVVEKVVGLAEELNALLERRSDRARDRAVRIRAQAQIVVLTCFALAILLATLVGIYLMRSISRPMAELRRGAMRFGAGDLQVELHLPGADEFAELGRVFNQMTRDLSRHHAELLEANRLASIGQVASGVAHEINNPLGVILGYTVLLRSDPGLRDRDELAIIEDEVRQCQRIVSGLLDLARPVRLHLGEVDLGDVVAEAVARLADSGKSAGVDIDVDQSAPPAAIRADEMKLKQIVVNLLMNAVEAASDERAATRSVQIRWVAQGDRVGLEVIDGGPGVPAEALPRLFEPFFSTKDRGHGLGLAIARSLARAHGGDVVVGPRGGAQGARAALLLPHKALAEAAS